MQEDLKRGRIKLLLKDAKDQRFSDSIGAFRRRVVYHYGDEETAFRCTGAGAWPVPCSPVLAEGDVVMETVCGYWVSLICVISFMAIVIFSTRRNTKQ